MPEQFSLGFMPKQPTPKDIASRQKNSPRFPQIEGKHAQAGNADSRRSAFPARQKKETPDGIIALAQALLTDLERRHQSTTSVDPTDDALREDISTLQALLPLLRKDPKAVTLRDAVHQIQQRRKPPSLPKKRYR